MVCYGTYLLNILKLTLIKIKIMSLLLTIINAFIFAWLAISVVYIFIHSLAGLFYSVPKSGALLSYPKVVVLIPAYKEDEVILNSVKNAILVFSFKAVLLP